MTAVPPHSPAGPGPGAPVPPAVPSQARPGKLWFWVSGAVALVSVLAFGLGLLLIHNPIRPEPEVVETIEAGEAVSFSVTDGELGEQEWAIYASVRGSMNCRYSGPDVFEDFPTGENARNESHGDWFIVGFVPTPSPGEYVVHCSGAHGMEADPNIDFMLGSADAINSLETQQTAGQVLSLGVAPVGLLAAVALAVVTGVRRGRHKHQQTAEWAQGEGIQGQGDQGQDFQGR